MKYFITLSLLIITALTLNAQKKVLTIDDFANWNAIKKQQISNNGQYIVYELNQQHGDGQLILHNLENSSNDTIKLGYDAKLSPNSDFLVCKLKPSTDTLRKAKLAEVKKDKMPKDSALIYNFKTKEITKYPKLKSFKVAEENTSWVALLKDYQAPPKDTTLTDSTKAEPKKEKKKNTKELIIYNPVKDTSFTFTDVEDYNFSKNGKIIAFTTQSKDSVDIGTVITFNTSKQSIDTIYRDTTELKKITIDDSGTFLAFLNSKDTVKNKTFAANIFNVQKKQLLTIDTTTQGLPKNFAPSENGSIYFSEDGSKFFFGTANKPINEPKDSILDEDKPKLDIWSWTDKILQPQQLKNLDKEKKRSYLAVYHLKENKLVQLADSINKNIQLINKNNGDFAIAHNNENYIRATSWTGEWFNDYYLIDLHTGEKELITKGEPNLWLAPDANYAIWYSYKDSIYYSWNKKSKKIIALTNKLNIPFYYERNDMPTHPSPYGLAGWSTDKKTVFIYDRYDIWKIDMLGKAAPINITDGNGRKDKIRYRYIKLDKELVYLPENKDILLRGFNESKLQEGFYKTTLSQKQTPKEQLTGPYLYSRVYKAKDENKLIWTRQNVQEYPNIRISDFSFKNSKAISDANPQQKEFNWATTEIVEWTSFTGEKLKGILYKPENFDSNKKYPMISYFYELSTERLHYHYTPYPSHSIINKTFYASKGYLVFVPDITYKTSYPGQSAYNAIISGINHLTNTHKFIDREKLALQGQSWGGYQTAYLVTQTDMFAAAMAGAPVSNMTSAYGGIRWGSGMSRMFQYEHTQSRIGGTLWEKHLQYIENSPIFYAPKITTPLLIMHNDNDGAVPWYQGIEMFVAMRRLNKPAWMLNYNGMAHNIQSKYWANRIDLSKRMLQFFNHYLKDEPAPEWMIKGIPAVEKGKNLGY